ncbi:HET-domain-containing protein [Penicillium malachiteum]|nr:HET-domain-containing protein [Penicillium malachiteum]
MQSNTDYIPGPSKICRLCKVLEFNDQEYHKLLAETEHIKPVTNGDSYPKRHLEGAEPYKRIDTLPNLPILSGSTSCDFCQLLKGQLQLFWEEWNEERKQSTAKIRTTRFSYYCEDRVKPFTVQPWLSALCIYFTIGSDNGTEHEITFDLHVLPDGMYSAENWRKWISLTSNQIRVPSG